MMAVMATRAGRPPKKRAKTVAAKPKRSKTSPSLRDALTQEPGATLQRAIDPAFDDETDIGAVTERVVHIAATFLAHANPRGLDSNDVNAATNMIHRAVALLARGDGVDEIRSAWRVLRGGRPDDEDAIRIRQIAFLLEHGALHVSSLTPIDRAFAKLSTEMVADIQERHRTGKLRTSGAIADLLIAARALGTSGNATRGDVQGRVDKALRRA